MQAGAEHGLLVFADGFAEAQEDGFVLLLDDLDARQQENHHQPDHDDFEDRETTAQRVRQRLRPGIVHDFRHRLGMRRMG